jgi:hypothetical protein
MKRYLLILSGLFLLAQAIRPTRTVEPIDPAADLIAVTHPSVEVEGILRTACYDCHSGQPRYPWYVNITPVNWWLQGHINEGREHFDVSAWGRITEKKRSHWAEEAMEMVQEGEMPLNSYTWTHADARLSEAQRAQLVAFFKPLHTMPEGNGDRERH